MSTRITVTGGTGALVNRVKQVQQANREAQLQRERDVPLQVQLTAEMIQSDQAQQPRGGNPDTNIKRRPAAQRFASGIFAAELTTRYDEASDTFFVKAGVPGVATSVEVATAASGRGSVTLLPSVSDTGLFTAYGRVSKDASTNEWSIYRNGSFGGGTNFSDRLAEPPRSSNLTDYSYLASRRTADESQSFLLPLSSAAGILVYLQNRIDIFNKYTRSINSVHSSVNERNIRVNFETQQPYAWGEPGYWADWDAQGHVRWSHDYTGQETFAAYELIAFFVSNQGVKQITVPTALETLLQQIYPAVSVNGTASYLDEINYDQYYAHSYSGFVDITTTNYTTTYQDEPAFSRQAWQQASRYGVLANGSFALPRHFGLGYLNTGSHSGPFFTPAVYRFLTGPMALSDVTAQSYASMRADYFPTAPFRFYAPCARSGACQDATVKEFDVTRTQPATVTSALAASLFRRSTPTDVAIGEPEGDILYAWDWGKPAQCRRQLLDLGFTPEDLRL